MQLIYAYKVKRAYERMCQPLCNQIGLPRTAFDILMFLGNHPTLNAAKDIVEIRGLKANHVSINVERLVNDGYLQRKEDTKDRRRMILLCTDKAGPSWRRAGNAKAVLRKAVKGYIARIA